jgi:hypothetical protein
MKLKSNKLNPTESQTGNIEKNNFEGYPIYPENEDIYKNYQEQEEINPEDTTKKKEPNSTNSLRRKDLDDDLDIPGAELDDLQEDIGNEDEENNYYSLGGDDHLDLEEDRGE